MHGPGILNELLIVYAVAAVVIFIFDRLKAPTMVGLLLTGVLMGPHGLGLISGVEQVELLAEIGVVVLLFTVGLELSLSRLLVLWPLMFRLGLPQFLGAGGLAFLVTWPVVGRWQSALFIGMLVAMSSTAVVMKLLTDKGELNTPHARVAVSILLLQDLLVSACMITLPLLSERPALGEQPWLRLLQGFLVVVAILVATRFAIPPLLQQVLGTRNRELFIIAIVLICLGTAGLTAWSGLSLALGAFLAGLALSDSEYAHQTLAEVLPFRDTLASLFFISVGMLLNVGFVLQNVLLVGLLVLILVLAKAFVVALPMALSNYPLRTTVLASLSLAQVGEFSFILASRGVNEFQLLGAGSYQMFLAAAVITMAMTPMLIALAPRLIEVWSRDEQLAAEESNGQEHPHKDHVIIAGYGLNGRNLASVLRDLDLPYVVVEMNPITVRREKSLGTPILLGDCSRAAILEHVGIHAARALVLVISDPAVTRRAVQTARQLVPLLHIIVRTRYVSEVVDLRRLGASEIIPEEFETSVEIFARVLQRFLIPRNVIIDLVDRVRHDHYEVLREGRQAASKMELPVSMLGTVETITCLIREDSVAVGKSLMDLDFRRQTGATVIAVRRQQNLISNPEARFQFQTGDVAILVGDAVQLDRAICMLDPRLSDEQVS